MCNAMIFLNKILKAISLAALSNCLTLTMHLREVLLQHLWLRLRYLTLASTSNPSQVAWH